MNKSSLRRQLVLPYVALVIFVSTAIAWVSYRAGEGAVRTLSQRVLGDMVQHIAGATEQHLASAHRVLNALAPDPATVPRPQAFADDLDALEPRLWTAAGLFMEANNYVYFGGADGRFIGVERISKDVVQLYLREPGAAKRTVYTVATPGDRSRVLRTDAMDPRARPWYAAARAGGPVWSPVYHDFSSGEPTVTLAKAVYHADRSLAGVVATDVTLRVLTDFLRTLKIGDNGVAFVLDNEGYVVATSGAELPFRDANGRAERIRPQDMRTPLIRDAMRQLHNRKPAAGSTQTNYADGNLDIAATRFGQPYGLDWTAVVAVPHADFMGGVRYNFLEGLFITIVCIVLALVLGLAVLNRVLRDLRQLSDAVRRIGDGEPLPSLNIRRHDEIGQLAQTFSEMEHNLRIDKLTAVFNRASLIAQIGALRRQLAQPGLEKPTFALLFVDLDHFKVINDEYGHDAGDKVLATVAGRLKASVRVTDVVARYGGDEFVVLLKGITQGEDVDAMARTIRDVVEAPIAVTSAIVKVGVSIGWALFPEDGEDVDALLKIADTRMFDTKKSRKAAR